MNALAGGLMFLAMVSYILGTYLIRRDRRREELQHPDPATISTVCMMARAQTPFVTTAGSFFGVSSKCQIGNVFSLAPPLPSSSEVTGSLARNVSVTGLPPNSAA